MFDSSPSLHPYLKAEVERAEALAGIQVISAQIFNVPYVLYDVECEIQQSRRMGLLEEYLLRAAVEIQPPIRGEDLADMLRVDPRFVEHTYRELVQLQVLTASNDRRLRATPTGETFYRQDRIPQPPQIVQRTLVSVLPFTTFALYDPDSPVNAQLEEGEFPDFPHSPALEKKLHPVAKRDDITGPLLVQVTAQAGKPLDRPDDSLTMERVTAWHMDRSMYYSHWGVLVIHDLAASGDDALSIQLRSLDLPIHGQKKAMGAIEAALHELIDRALREKILPLADLLLAPAEAIQPPFPEAESRITAVEEIVRRRVVDLRYTQPDPAAPTAPDATGTAELIPDGEIRRSFLAALKSAQRRVLLVWPGLNDQAVDDELMGVFKTLAARRVITLLGWGSQLTQADEKTPPSEALSHKLAAITTPDGLPAVVVTWLGRQHSQDVIVDHAVHLCGAPRWLTYRGDQYSRGTPVYRVTLPEPVQHAAGILEPLFAPGAETADLPRLVATRIACGQFAAACQHVLHAAQESTPDALNLLVSLCQVASEARSGATPAARAELLQALGDGGETLLKGQPKALAKSVQRLMNALSEQDPAEARQIREAFEGVWTRLGVT